MNDFKWRICASLGILGFGIAGFSALFMGSEVLTAIKRATITGGVFFFAGIFISHALFQGYIELPKAPNIGKGKEEEKKP